MRHRSPVREGRLRERRLREGRLREGRLRRDLGRRRIALAARDYTRRDFAVDAMTNNLNTAAGTAELAARSGEVVALVAGCGEVATFTSPDALGNVPGLVAGAGRLDAKRRARLSEKASAPMALRALAVRPRRHGDRGQPGPWACVLNGPIESEDAGSTRPRVYVAHPMTTYGTEWEATCLARIAELLPGVELVEPARRYRDGRAWLTDWPRLRQALSGLVVFGDEDGYVGAGCWREIGDAVAWYLPVAVLDGKGRLCEIDRFDLAPLGRRTPGQLASIIPGRRLDAKRFAERLVPISAARPS